MGSSSASWGGRPQRSTQTGWRRSLGALRDVKYPSGQPNLKERAGAPVNSSAAAIIMSAGALIYAQKAAFCLDWGCSGQIASNTAPSRSAWRDAAKGFVAGRKKRVNADNAVSNRR